MLSPKPVLLQNILKIENLVMVAKSLAVEAEVVMTVAAVAVAVAGSSKNLRPNAP